MFGFIAGAIVGFIAGVAAAVYVLVKRGVIQPTDINKVLDRDA
jgi:hypothetical protein